MTICSDLADYQWLTGDEAGAILAELAEDRTPLHTVAAHLRSRFSINQTHLLLEQAELRRRATAKFTQAHQMFFTRVGLEQATDEWVARYKADRFQVASSLRDAIETQDKSPLGYYAGNRIADLCTGIGGDLQALTASVDAFGIDRDPIAAHFASVNAHVPVHTTDIANLDLREITAFHIDPDRRPFGKRTTSLDHCEPSLTVINRLLSQIPHAAIKLAPAAIVPGEWSGQCEFEWISRDRECRQLVAWHGSLARSPGMHRATVITSEPASTPRTIVGQPKLQPPLAHKAARYLFDIDPAVLAAKLKGVLAAEHDLSALSAGPTYLTGDTPIADPALRCFEIDEVLPFRATPLASHLRTRNIGQLEIKMRGVDSDPEKLRRQLKLRGTGSATLLVTVQGGRPIAFLARRINR